MNAAVKQYSFQFVSDGLSLTLNVDVSLAPFLQDFAGNLPVAVLDPGASSQPTGILAGVTATLSGTVVTLTFNGPPPQTDPSGNLIVYTATFILEFGNQPA